MTAETPAAKATLERGLPFRVNATPRHGGMAILARSKTGLVYLAEDRWKSRPATLKELLLQLFRAQVLAHWFAAIDTRQLKPGEVPVEITASNYKHLALRLIPRHSKKYYTYKENSKIWINKRELLIKES